MRRPHNRKLLFLWTVLVILGCIGKNSAHAGYWEEIHNPYDVWGPYDQNWKDENALRLDGDVSWNVPTTWVINPADAAKSYPWKEVGPGAAGFTIGGFADMGGNGGPAHSGSHGYRKSLFRWIPDNTADTPPAILGLKVYLRSDAAIETLAGSMDTSNILQTSVEDVTGSTTNDGNSIISSQAKKIFLLQILTNGQDEIWTPWFKFDTDIQINTTDPNTSQLATTYFTYNVQPDNRRLHLTRTGAIGEIIRGNTTYGHSRFSYKDVLTGTPVDIPVDQEYVRHISGSWGSNPDWEWTPEGNDDAAMYSIQTNEYGNRNKNVDGHWVGTPTTPRVQTTTYRLQDPNDGTVAEAVYELILHDEWENLRKDPAKTPIAQHAYFPSGPSINLDWAENRTGVDGATGSWTQNIEVSHAFELGFDLSVSPVDLVDLGFSFTESFQNTYGTSFGITSPPIPNMKHCYPYVHLHWNREHYLIDHYIPAGPHRNSLRLNNGEIDATHDGSWEGWADDYPGGASPGWSEMYNIDDFDGDGLPD